MAKKCFEFHIHCRHQESIDELRMLYDMKERKIIKQQQTYKAFREKLSVS